MHIEPLWLVVGVVLLVLASWWFKRRSMNQVLYAWKEVLPTNTKQYRVVQIWLNDEPDIAYLWASFNDARRLVQGKRIDMIASDSGKSMRISLQDFARPEELRDKILGIVGERND